MRMEMNIEETEKAKKVRVVSNLMGQARYGRMLLVVALFVVPFAGWSQAKDAFVGRVIKVIDGDTVTLLVNDRRVRVRLTEIDAPERDQPWGVEAANALSEKVYRLKVSVQPSGADGGRILGRIFMGSRDISKEMIQEGHAWAYRQYLTDDSLIGDEEHAKAQNLGLWSLPESDRIPPWEWRHAGSKSPDKVVESPKEGAEKATGPTTDSAFSCGGKRYCKEMSSCAEAMFYLKECGLTRLDGDSDGVPCEELCR